jgi:hypothetical protein
VHVACRDNPDQSSVTSDGESNVQAPPVVRTTQGVETRLKLTVRGIFEQQKRLVEKDLFGLGLTDPVFVQTLASVPRVPLKALAPRQIYHVVYMRHIYILGQLSNSVVWNRGAVPDMSAW